jgi:hypothetical protein
MAPIAERHRRAFDAQEYAAMVHGVRAVIEASLPPGAAVAVISRGDEDLLRLGPRTSLHFPRSASGAYAGHHPPDSAAAIAHLQELRSGGVRHLVVPATARWWLDHYEAFADHLDQHWSRLADDAACTVFAYREAAPVLAAPPAHADGEPDHAATVDPTTVQRAGHFLDALLPDGCQVLLAGLGWEDLELPGRTLQRLEHGTGPTLMAVEAQRNAGSTGYLVVPSADGMGWLAELLAVMEERHAPLARRASLVTVFELLPVPIAIHERAHA